MSTDKRVFTLRMQPENYDKVRVLAAINKRSVAKHIEYLVEKNINEYEAHNGAIPLTEEEHRSKNTVIINNQINQNGNNNFDVANLE